MVILGLGSNIGDRLGWLAAAVARLAPLLVDMRISRVFESPALLPDNAPGGWNQPFLNMAVGGVSGLAPQEWFSAVKTIERELGRKPGGIWCPREIDIDILAIDDVVLKTPELTIPHRGLLERPFALLPLIDVAPNWRAPGGELALDIARNKGFAVGAQLRDLGKVVHV